MSSSIDILGEVECHSFEETTFRKKLNLSSVKLKNAMRLTEKINFKFHFSKIIMTGMALIYILIIVRINECI